MVEMHIAPEISPKVRTVFFIGFKSPSVGNLAGTRGLVVTLLGDSAWESEKSSFRVVRLRSMARTLRDQPGGFTDLHGLGATPGAQLVKQPARMRLHRVLAHEQPDGNLAIAQ